MNENIAQIQAWVSEHGIMWDDGGFRVWEGEPYLYKNDSSVDNYFKYRTTISGSSHGDEEIFE